MINKDVLIEAIDMAWDIKAALKSELCDEIRTTLEHQLSALLFLIRHDGSPKWYPHCIAAKDAPWKVTQ
jgi:hypothetical protein